MRLAQSLLLSVTLFSATAGWAQASPGNNWTVGPEWRLLGGSNASSVYINRSQPIREGAYLKAWFLWTYNEQKTFKPGIAYNSSKSLDLFDCKSRTTATRQFLMYLNVAGVGDPVQTTVFNKDELNFQDPPPGSIGETILESVCGKPKH